MNEAGVLGRFIPDFGKVVPMMQFNMYHHYTVDEHLIRTVGVSDIERGVAAEPHPLATKIFSTIRTAAPSTWLHSCTTSPRAAPRTIPSRARVSPASCVHVSA
jgi:hypothetical protein